MSYFGENLENLGGTQEEQENNKDVFTKIEEAPEEILESYSEIAREGIRPEEITKKSGEIDRFVELVGNNGSFLAIEKAASENMVKVKQINDLGEEIETLVEVIVDKENGTFELRKITEPKVVQSEENSYNEEDIKKIKEEDMEAIKRFQEAIANTPAQAEA